MYDSELEYITKFKIIEKIATGGMGSIYLAEQWGAHGFRKNVVIKTIRASLLTDEDTLQMFIGEAKLVANLVHENIVQVYQFEESAGTYYLIMEYAAGPNLEIFLERHKFMKKMVPVDMILLIISNIARGLEYAHRFRDREGKRLKIVHRDISPSNIIITYQGVIKLTDFGIAKALTMNIPDEREVVMGKYPYMSPEQAHFEGTDLRSDIFSLGLVAYELLTTEMVFKVEDGDALLKAMQKPIPPPHIINPSIPTPISNIVMKALEMIPEKRFQSAGEMRKALINVMKTMTSPPTNEKLAKYVELLFPEAKKKMSTGQIKIF